ncbi:hypothetical protein RF11_11405 [Thelohanellus kitauei]|uniref:Uncharacterized protein n=1 Tax=Thelohanellus kitauei TaxID=669202 RepID=A0A0C2N3V0_THEKT|nr:hypothetical protein RF11_11405 [Thelohanellus kitauei]
MALQIMECMDNANPSICNDEPFYDDFLLCTRKASGNEKQGIFHHIAGNLLFEVAKTVMDRNTLSEEDNFSLVCYFKGPFTEKIKSILFAAENKILPMTQRQLVKKDVKH